MTTLDEAIHRVLDHVPAEEWELYVVPRHPWYGDGAGVRAMVECLRREPLLRHYEHASDFAFDLGELSPWPRRRLFEVRNAVIAMQLVRLGRLARGYDEHTIIGSAFVDIARAWHMLDDAMRIHAFEALVLLSKEPGVMGERWCEDTKHSMEILLWHACRGVPREHRVAVMDKAGLDRAIAELRESSPGGYTESLIEAVTQAGK